MRTKKKKGVCVEGRLNAPTRPEDLRFRSNDGLLDCRSKSGVFSGTEQLSINKKCNII
jgi:hypothetical protein